MCEPSVEPTVIKIIVCEAMFFFKAHVLIRIYLNDKGFHTLAAHLRFHSRTDTQQCCDVSRNRKNESNSRIFPEAYLENQGTQ